MVSFGTYLSYPYYYFPNTCCSVPFPLNGDNYEFIVQAQNLAACPDQGRCIRPVGLDFDRKGRLFVSSDSSGEVFVVEASK